MLGKLPTKLYSQSFIFFSSQSDKEGRIFYDFWVWSATIIEHVSHEQTSIVSWGQTVTVSDI